ncbi:hypothetical protein [Fictibacillus phosphorivorans]|uniref:hypothetical protein n=1 Tax=Fictibacillus phosphorivorans TaxID=1221500 RepID=UPI00203AB8B8|nr:hypothetical protein [Fictibacillus phosphorivorans]MCM3718577.1 hypothetical protein [Fictibacillus phosphorivorans]MCM3776200.1 hypothetical protein [Fictibacillus phosphorivorans]
MKNPISIYLITFFTMIALLLTIDWSMGISPITVLRRSFISFFKYVDKIELVLVIFLFFLPILTCLWSNWMKKKQNA